MNIKELILNEISKKKLTSKQLRSLIHIKGEEEEAAFFSALKELEEEGKIYLDSKEYYQEFDEGKLNKVQGEIHINNTGSGFVIKKGKKGKRKYIIKEKDLNGALDGDVVVLNSFGNNGTNYLDARVEKIIKRGEKNAVFEYVGSNTFIPYNVHGKIKVICPETKSDIVIGNLAVVKLGTNYIAEAKDNLIYEGNVSKVIGHKDDPEIEIAAIAATHGFFNDFSDKVLEELKQIPDSVSEEEIEGRVDLRKEKIFTIDGADTKDMDDAVSIKKDGENYILSVHIADVSHYVKKGSNLDKEAFIRGTSAYLADSVLPMLPHKLSNGICSLNEKVDRLTKTVKMIINKNGKILDYEIYNSVINSKKKMTYEEVNEILENKVLIEGYEDYLEELNIMRELSIILTEKRKNRGNIEFSSDEIKAIVTKEGTPTSFEQRTQKTAERIIENFMICANEIVTTHYAYMGVPFIYRVHGDPHDDALIDAINSLKADGLYASSANNLLNKINNGTYTSRDLDNFIESFKGTDDYGVVSNYILTSMSKAKYSSINEGHYGLALEFYTHFTSPIRRYPDLIVHRLIDSYSDFETVIDKLDIIESSLPEICAHSSKMEREADIAESETLDLKMAEFIKEHIGEEYNGQIVKMTPYGMDVKMENNIKGVVRPEAVSSAKKSLNKKFKLGERICVIVKEVSVPHRAIYLEIKHSLNKKPKQKTKRSC
ncbi:MAG: ribonuclease R [Bacilli bacterium]|nr:ribonuclease R [Bacilli bacterium]